MKVSEIIKQLQKEDPDRIIRMAHIRFEDGNHESMRVIGDNVKILKATKKSTIIKGDEDGK